MKISKQQEKEILKEYKVYFDSYISGDVETITQMLEEDYIQIGSAETEVFFNKQEAVQFLKETIDQIAGITKMENRFLRVDPLHEYVLVTDIFDIYVLTEEAWVYYDKLRASTLMQKKEDGWKFIHQHSSIADSRTADGDNIAVEKIAEENKELREAVKRRTVELEHNQKELEIEASLERVRTVAMGMRKSEDMLSVCKMISQQLESLNVTDIRNVQTAIIYESRGTYLNYQYYASYDKEITEELEYVKHPTVHEMVRKMQESTHAFFSGFFEGDELAEFRDYRKKDKQFSDPLLDKTTSLHYHFYSIGDGGLGISTYKPMSAGGLEIFKRFHNVFELAYRRFVDIEKAMAQAREAQIEAALERVRSRSMAMHKSDELADLSLELVKQVQALGVETWFCAFNIYDDDPKGSLEWGSNGQGTFPRYRTPREGIFLRYYETGQSGETLLINEIDENECPAHYDYLCSLPGVGEQLLQMKDAGIPFPASQIDHVAFFKYGYILFITFEPVPEAHDIFKRFAKVFEQTYTRFLDLQKSEAQAREAQIEGALEKVRSHTMGMRSSEELANVATVMFDQLRILGGDLFSCGIVLCDKDKNEVEQWHSLPGAGMLPPFYVPIDLDYIHQYRYDQWKGGVELFSIEIPEDKIARHFELMETIPSLKKFMEAVAEKGIKMPEWPDWEIDYGASFRYGYILVSALQPFEKQQILPRFAKVFEQTYTRFLDLKKAESQAREAQIEAALERTRTQSMLMQHSNELEVISKVFHQQLLLLDIPSEFSYVWLPDEPNEKHLFWATWEQKNNKSTSLHSKSIIYDLDKTEPYTAACFKAWESNDPVHMALIPPKEVKTFFNTWSELIHGAKNLKAGNFPGGLYYAEAYMKYGCFGINIREKPNEEEQEIIRRFAVEFERTYTRFIDLKKAEAQAREAQIEAALERVRSKTMAMHNSQDVGTTVISLFEEVLNLGLDKTIRCGIGILDKETDYMETRSANSHPNGEVDFKMGMLDMRIHPMLVGLKKAWGKGESGYSYDYIGEDVHRYYEALSREPEYPFKVDLEKLPENEYHNSFFFTEGILFAFAENPFSEESAKVLSRFAGVFGQTYRRYLDLQKAEEQAREAQIEAALERVRARSMAMQKSEELAETASHLFMQFADLGIQTYRCNIAIIDKENDLIQLWSTTNSGQVIPISSQIPLTEYPVFRTIYDEWKRKEKRSVIKLVGEDRLRWTNYISQFVHFEEYKPGKINANKVMAEMAVFTNFYFQQGYFVIHTTKDLSEPDMDIIQRFAKVFEQTFTRFLDLKKAEFQANEVIKQASLDRVRGQIASMRSTDDLQRITPLIWSELETLEVPFNRCGVFIIDELVSQVRVYLTTPDGKPLGVLELPFDANDLTRNTIEHWRNKTVYAIHWNKNDFIDWVQSMVKLGQIQNINQYQGNVAPPETLDLHFIPFGQGMLYVGNHEPLAEDKIDLVKSLAKSFSVAYARYEDFKQLETAKNKIEITLNDLKSTQTQLIQAEKMASLGELTAGIAHEIQNPLNFVNNFSEVNAELIEELKEEADAGDLEEVKAIADDIAINEKKIYHHGKRADAIVKGMLQHSRTTKGEKELTDINELADEYLRLAYHGLRAKDKSFNASFNADLDEALPKVEVVAQDIGRVLLNLINNAFYAVSAEATAKADSSYKPQVTITTIKRDEKVEIRVKDNGHGIPSNIKEKIFQPFFTTKPTGQGTGLGLSLSFDIVTKGHGGEMKVISEENKGSEFIIIIPIATSL